MILKLNKINKVFNINKNEKFNALSDIDLEFSKGEFVSIVGASGSGKSTLLNIIAGLDIPTTGELLIGGKSSKKFKKQDWDLYRKNNIGFVFQNFNLIEHLTALENVEIVMNLIGMKFTNRKKRATELLQKVGLGAHLNHRPSELSGGQKQRVAIARALANDPDIILADEPTGALDVNTGTEIMQLISSISKEKLVIMVTHNDELANEYSSRKICVSDGKIISDESLKEVTVNTEKSLLVKKNAIMSFFEAFRLSIRNMKKKKGRVLITTIAGAIGIIGLTLIAGLGNGANMYIDKQLNKFGTANVLTLTKYNSETSKESTDIAKDKSEYDKILNDDYIKSKVVDKRQYIYTNEAKLLKSDGTEYKENQIFALANESNREFLKENLIGNLPIKGNNELLVNQVTARNVLKDIGLEDNEISKVIGKPITMVYHVPNTEFKFEKEFKIAGIVEELDLGFLTAYYEYSDMYDWLTSINMGDKNLFELMHETSFAYEITIGNVNDVKEVSNYINAKENGGSGKISLMNSFKLDPGYSAQNIGSVIKNIFEQIVFMAQAVISIFIFVSLLVSAMMTAIVLYSSVVERKTEIGIIKAVGGRNKDVIRIFQSEAILMGLFSGIIGLISAFILAPILEKIITEVLNLDLPGIVTIPVSLIPFTDIKFPFATIIVILIFSSLVSAISGYLPAKRATKLRVVDALRDE